MTSGLPVFKRVHPLFFIVYMICAFFCLSGFLIAVVTCIDRADEWFNALRYQGDWRTDFLLYHNKWEPFRGGLIARILQIPEGLYVGFADFTLSATVGLLLFPLLVLIVPLHDFFSAGDYGFLLYGWAPFITGGTVFVCAVLLHESYVLDKKGLEQIQTEANFD